MEQTLWVIQNMCGHPRTHEVLPLSMSCLISLSVLICDVWRSVRHLLSSPNGTGFHHFYHHRFLSSRSVCLTGRFTAAVHHLPTNYRGKGESGEKRRGKKSGRKQQKRRIGFSSSSISIVKHGKNPPPSAVFKCCNIIFRKQSV